MTLNSSDMPHLLREDIFQNQGLHQSVKPSILSTFGDIAMAIGPVYTKYLQVVIHILKQASEATVDKVTNRVL